MSTIFTIGCLSATAFLVVIFIAEVLNKHASKVAGMVHDDGEHM